jgi:hypothetical protein
VLDFLGMFIYLSHLVAINVSRAARISPATFWRVRDCVRTHTRTHLAALRCTSLRCAHRYQSSTPLSAAISSWLHDEALRASAVRRCRP